MPELPFRQVVYDCIDDLEVHVPSDSLRLLYQGWEDELISRAGAAVVSAELLGDGLRARAPGLRVGTIRNGVDAVGFRTAAATLPRPPELADPSSSRPVVGFVGALYDWIDWPLIESVAGQLPEADFVLVGPGSPPAGIAERARNLRLLGPRPYAQVPAYIGSFDVCWVPFKAGPVSDAANPVKLYEYLALGKPVVSTRVADPESFEGLIDFGSSAAEIVSLLRAALSKPGDAEPRARFAEANSWESRASSYAEFCRRMLTDLAGSP